MMIDVTKPTVFVDCGLTLLEAKSPDSVPLKEGWFEVPPWDEHSRPTLALPRPSARPFLEALRDRELQVFVLSGGGFHDQANALRACGLLERTLIKYVYGADNSDGLRVPQRWILVDDDGDPTDKFRRLGKDKSKLGANWGDAIARHLVQCSKFFWGDDSEPLTNLLELVDQKLARQSTT